LVAEVGRLPTNRKVSGNVKSDRNSPEFRYENMAQPEVCPQDW
jgi:hypothetical protein